jgi:hypothetical protein
MLNFPRIRGTRFRVDFAPQLRDTLSRGFLILDLGMWLYFAQSRQAR